MSSTQANPRAAQPLPSMRTFMSSESKIGTRCPDLWLLLLFQRLRFARSFFQASLWDIGFTGFLFQASNMFAVSVGGSLEFFLFG